MRINHLAFRNFKGFKGSYDLGPVTLVTGKNFSHKTSIPMAIRLALSGKLPPPIGIQGVYALAGNPDGQGDMVVELILGDRKVLWSWAKDAKGKVTVDGGVPADLAMPDMLLEPRLFWQKTAAERVKTIFAACDLGDLDISASISGRLSQIQVPPVSICEPLLDSIREKMRSLPSEPVQLFCSMLLDWVKTEQKAASDTFKIAQGAFAAFRTGDASERPTDVSTALNEARDKMLELHSNQRQGANPAAERRRLAIQQELSRIPALNNSELPDCPVDPEEIDDVIPDLMRGLAKAEKDFTESSVTLKSLEERISVLTKSECCPTCGAKRKGWKEAALEELDNQHGIAEALNGTAKAAIKAISEQITGIKAYQLAQSKLNEDKALLAKKEALEKELAELGNSEPDPDLDEQIRALQCDIQVLESKQRQWDTHKNDIKRREILEKDLLSAQCKVDVFKAVSKIITEEQGKLIDTAFGQVLKTAKYFTDGLLNSPLEFTNGELGRRVSAQDKDQGNTAPVGSWISHEVFSGTEELLAYAGFSVALAADAPVKVVMLDELGRLDPQRKVDITQRMLQLTSKGIVDQAILVDVAQKDYAGIIQQNKDLKVIAL